MTLPLFEGAAALGSKGRTENRHQHGTNAKARLQLPSHHAEPGAERVR